MYANIMICTDNGKKKLMNILIFSLSLAGFMDFSYFCRIILWWNNLVHI